MTATTTPLRYLILVPKSGRQAPLPPDAVRLLAMLAHVHKQNGLIPRVQWAKKSYGAAAFNTLDRNCLIYVREVNGEEWISVSAAGEALLKSPEGQAFFYGRESE